MSATVDQSPGSEEADLHVLNFCSLQRGDESEKANLLSACEEHRFFYLDLRDWESGEMLHNLEEIWNIMKKWFDQPLQEKLKTETISDAHGFKPPGVQSGVTEHSRDGFEALRISRVCLLGRSHLPEVVRENLHRFESFQLSAHFLLKSLLGCLSDAAQLKGSDRFESYHPDGLPSRSTMFFIHHPVSDALDDKRGRGHNAHTDVGSFTLLFTEQPGLQVLSPKTNKWEYVVAKQGHAIVNVADTLRFISQRRFRSAMHRVLPPGGKMLEDRYSAAYFLLASDSAFLSKYSSFNKTLQEQRLDSVATGGMDKDLGLLV
ncbi:hypothetical protein BKA59DRAFT_490269 [Fusarium tricinctum]|uniref:Fe2OG dioxygenase domain-containing protein n=1 Tax=Fusarium tricinctum TaxID=61284 RepID=A0A8K0WE38_9HYPO|nr:hypothetical protein BKA59DRAFT_490269 [Fusarium tricinctum]